MYGWKLFSHVGFHWELANQSGGLEVVPRVEIEVYLQVARNALLYITTSYFCGCLFIYLFFPFWLPPGLPLHSSTNSCCASFWRQFPPLVFPHATFVHGGWLPGVRNAVG